MNIFYLDTNPRLAALMQCDTHVVKMILESAQLLSTAHHVVGSATDDMYKATHINHPSAVWVRESRKNYRWLFTHFKYLCAEYTYRYGRVHKSESLTEILSRSPVITANSATPIKLAMPDEYRQPDPVQSYRDYYRSKKHTMGKRMVWTRRTKPEWMEIEQ